MEDVIATRIASETKLAEALYRLIAFCEQERPLSEIEEEASAYPEMRGSAFPLSTVLGWLVDVSAIEVLPCPSADPDATEASRVDAAIAPDPVSCVDGIEDAVFAADAPSFDGEGDQRFVSTSSGLEALARYRAVDRLDGLDCFEGRYEEVFVELLRFCEVPRSKRSIEARLKGNRLTENPRVFPGFFIDRLERAGALCWDEGWKTSEAGGRWAVAREGKR